MVGCREHMFGSTLLGSGFDEGRTALLRSRQSEGKRLAGGRRGQRPVALLAKLSKKRPVAHPDRTHQAGSGGQGKKRVPKTNQPARRDQVLEPHPAFAVVRDLQHLAAALAERFGHGTEVLLAHVNGQMLDGFHALAVDLFHDCLWTRDFELVALAAHRLNEHGEVQLTTSADQELLCGFGVFDVKAQVCVELFVESRPQLASGRELSFQSGERRGSYSEVAREVLRATSEELRANSRSRSAKLRWARRSTIDAGTSVEQNTIM